MTPRPRAPQEQQEAPDPTDEQLDAWILARLTVAGIDITVLPEDDRDAPADQRRILSSARRFLRGTPSRIASFPLDAQGVPPVMYPAELTGRTPVGDRPEEG